MLPDGRSYHWVEPVLFWKQYKVGPWVWDGLSDQEAAQDLPTMEYWREKASIVEEAQSRAQAYVSSLSATDLKNRATRIKMRAMYAEEYAAQGIDT